MATVGQVTTRAQAEAPTCCNQQMGVLGADYRNVEYQCRKCLAKAKGRDPHQIGQEINKGTLKPVDRQEAAPVTRTAPAAAASADQEHNAAVLKRILADIGAVLNRGTDTINTLNRRNGALVGQVADAGEFAVATQQTDRCRHALDEANGLATTMDQHLGGMSSAVGEAEQAITAALGGLRVVDDAHDDLIQAGAGVKAAAPARDGA